MQYTDNKQIALNNKLYRRKWNEEFFISDHNHVI